MWPPASQWGDPYAFGVPVRIVPAPGARALGEAFACPRGRDGAGNGARPGRRKQAAGSRRDVAESPIIWIMETTAGPSAS